MVSWKGRHFLKLLDYSPEEIGALLDYAAELKAQKKAGIPHRIHEGKNVALIFEKTSTRTRCAAMKHEVKYCHQCHNISDADMCPICADPRRDATTICVVENIQDVMAIENTQQYKGVYHVLGGIISPMDGMGPSDIEIESLVERVAEGDIREVILALSPTMEGDTTNFYIYRKLAPTGVKVSVIARGVAVGNELEYTDEVTLGRSIMNRTLFEDK